MWFEPEVAQKEPEVEEGFYKYKVLIYDGEAGKTEAHFGLVYGDTYTAAVDKIVQYFGNTIVTLYVYETDMSSILDLTDEKNNSLPDKYDIFTLDYKEIDNDF